MDTLNDKYPSFAQPPKTTLSNKRKRKFFIRRMAIAACLVLILSSILYMLLNSRPPTSPASANNDDMPVKNPGIGSPREKPDREDDNTYLYDKLVVIDPGHGGVDPGTTKGNLMEKDIVLDISLRVNDLLKKAKIKTILTRDDDTFMKPSEKIKFANDRDASLFLSIHCNYFDDSSVNGTSTFYFPSDYKDNGNLSGKEYAGIIQEELIKFIGTKNRGIDDGRKKIVLKLSKMPSALIELAFITNPSDAALLASDDFRQKAAEGIAEGIKKALEVLDSRADNDSTIVPEQKPAS